MSLENSEYLERRYTQHDEEYKDNFRRTYSDLLDFAGMQTVEEVRKIVIEVLEMDDVPSSPKDIIKLIKDLIIANIYSFLPDCIASRVCKDLPLRDFIVEHLSKGVPLNWFTGHMLSSIMKGFEMHETCDHDLFNKVMECLEYKNLDLIETSLKEKLAIFSYEAITVILNFLEMESNYPLRDFLDREDLIVKVDVLRFEEETNTVFYKVCFINRCNGNIESEFDEKANIQ